MELIKKLMKTRASDTDAITRKKLLHYLLELRFNNLLFFH